MDKKISISILFSFFLLIGLFGMTKVAIGVLDTSSTSLVLYGESVDNTAAIKTGLTETVNLTVGVGSSSSYVNISVDVVSGGQGNISLLGGFLGIDESNISAGDGGESTNVAFYTDTINVADWTCWNQSIASFSCNNNTLGSALGSNGTSLTIKFNVTSASGTFEDIEYLNISVVDTDGVRSSTVLAVNVDGLKPRLISLNVTDGNMTYVNDTETTNFYEIDANSPLTVYANIKEMNPASDSVYLVMNNSGTNVTDIPTANVWNRMTQLIPPTWNTEGVYMYTYNAAQMTDAFTIGNLTNFVIMVNDTYNNELMYNGSAASPFTFVPNSSLVEIVQTNFTTMVDDTIVTLTNPSSSDVWIAQGNATITVEVSGKEKGSLLLYFKEDGAFDANYANSISGESLIENLDTTNMSLTTGEGTTLYEWSIDFSNNHTNNPYVALVLNSTQTDNGDLSNLHNYSAFAVYNFRIDGLTSKPTFTVPDSATVTISDNIGILYTCNAAESESGVKSYTWTLTKSNGDVLTFTDSSTSDSLDRTFSGSNIDRAGTYSLTCKVTDNVGNSATSDSTSFAVSYQTVTGSSGGSSSSSSSTSSAVELFDIDFSTSAVGTIRAQQGRIKSFSFDGATKHTVTFDKVTATSITVTIASTPITVNLNARETKEVDINGDGISDLSVTLKSIVNGLANLEIKEIEIGAQVVEQEEKEAAGIVDTPDTTTPTTTTPDVKPVDSSNTGLWVTLLVVLIVVIAGYFVYQKK
jgi:hypothetical protein